MKLMPAPLLANEQCCPLPALKGTAAAAASICMETHVSCCSQANLTYTQSVSCIKADLFKSHCLVQQRIEFTFLQRKHPNLKCRGYNAQCLPSSTEVHTFDLANLQAFVE